MKQIVCIDYANWRGERAFRLVWPQQLWFGFNDGHPEPQWLLDAYDVEKDERVSAIRTFAMNGIHSWQPWPPVSHTSERKEE